MAHDGAAERIRDDLDRLQGQLAATPFAAAASAGALPAASYAGLLYSLRSVYRALRAALPSSPADAGPPVDIIARLRALDADLARIAISEPIEAPVAMLESELMSQRIRRLAQSRAGALAGYLYALERVVPAVLLPPERIAVSLGRGADQGLKYASGAPAAPELQRWLAALPPPERAVVLDGAAEALAGLLRVVDALYPLDADAQRELARTLNPFAGAHEVPSDRREVAAALRAGERTLDAFPYYALRYGERGTQFTRSDSAWLVTLAAHRLPVVEHQVLWLGRLLSARGMPQLLLERHLGALHAELVAAVPEKEVVYGTLAAVAESLRAIRTRDLPEAVFDTLEARFAAAVGEAWDRRLPHTGRLLAAAVADERAGISAAVRSVESWMTDAERFPPDWVSAVQRTIAAARDTAVQQLP